MPNITDSLIQGLLQLWYLPLLLIAFGLFKIYFLRLEKKFKQKRKMENHLKEVEIRRENKLKEMQDKQQNKEESRKRQRDFYIKNEEKGINLELLTGRKFEELGYKVEYNGLEKGKLDAGIDLICTKENEILLLQCKNYSKPKSITHEHIKIFHSNAMKYIKTNNLDERNTKLKYVIPNKEVLDISAIKVLMNDFYNCKYVVV
jgi:hypothetical protein